MVFQVVLRSQFPAPGIVDDHCRSKLGSLHNGPHFAAILHPLPSSFRQQEINSALFIAIAALEKSVSLEEELQAVLCRPVFEEFPSNGFWYQHN